MNRKEKENLLGEVERRVLDRFEGDPQKMERAIFDTLYEERHRFGGGKLSTSEKERMSFYNSIHSEALKAEPERQRELLKELLHYFAEDVCGHFNPLVYLLATQVVPPALTVLINTMSPLKMLLAIPEGMAGFKTLNDKLTIQGEVDALETVAKLGTTVLICTHQSNLDSVMMGFALNRLGLPPYTYGAAGYLFKNMLVGFFISNVGAYKVDRKNRSGLYKDVLKTFAGRTMELGYHNMFFPGGVRSRSGAVESHLKLGLLGMALDAYIHNLQAEKKMPDIFVVPCTLSYQVVLEAETLIDDYLKDVGKSRYIIEDDEFSEPLVVLNFVKKIFALDSAIHLTVSRPMDPFGNEVDDEGQSIDHRGRVIDRTRYVKKGGKPLFDLQRDHEYTRELADRVLDCFHRDMVIKSTHLVCYSIFNWLREQNADTGLYRLLRTGGVEESISLHDTYKAIDANLRELQRMEKKGRVRLSGSLKSGDATVILDEALQHLNAYHRPPVLKRRGDRLFHENRNLLYYYHNRLTGFGLDDRGAPS